ncbi:MAG: hypothetical protein ABEJ23_00820 [Haloarculaceae archaeon]
MVDEDRPPWWETNEAIRDRLDLPAYEPPRFADGTYTHAVVPELEAECDCTIRLLGVDTTYPEPWELRVDGEYVRDVARRRDADGNTVYGITAAAFRQAVREAADG